jgi:hypothetical protein
MGFNLSEVINIVSTIDELLSMSDHPYKISTSTGNDIKDNREVEFIEFVFPLKNGVSHIKIYDSTGLIEYRGHEDEVLKHVVFDDIYVTKLNGSFRKGFKQIREFDRQASSVKNSNGETAVELAEAPS